MNSRFHLGNIGGHASALVFLSSAAFCPGSYSPLVIFNYHYHPRSSYSLHILAYMHTMATASSYFFRRTFGRAVSSHLGASSVRQHFRTPRMTRTIILTRITPPTMTISASFPDQGNNARDIDVRQLQTASFTPSSLPASLAISLL